MKTPGESKKKIPNGGGRMVMNPIVQSVDKSGEKNQAKQNSLDLETHEWGMKWAPNWFMISFIKRILSLQGVSTKYITYNKLSTKRCIPSPTMQLVKSEQKSQKVLQKMNKVWFNF